MIESEGVVYMARVEYMSEGITMLIYCTYLDKSQWNTTVGAGAGAMGSSTIPTLTPPQTKGEHCVTV